MSFYDTESKVAVQSWNFQVKLLWYPQKNWAQSEPMFWKSVVETKIFPFKPWRTGMSKAQIFFGTPWIPWKLNLKVSGLHRNFWFCVIKWHKRMRYILVPLLLWAAAADLSVVSDYIQGQSHLYVHDLSIIIRLYLFKWVLLASLALYVLFILHTI